MLSDDFAEKILGSQTDLLGEQVLRQGGGEASFDACAAVLPELVGYHFLANGTSAQVIYVEPDGRLGRVAAEGDPVRLNPVLFNPRELLPQVAPTRIVRRLVGGYLPGINYSFYDHQRGVAWQEIAFLSPGRNELCVSLKVARAGAGEGTVRLRIGPHGRAAVEAHWFAARLAELEGHWESTLAEAMSLETAEPRVATASLATIVRALTVHEGARPHYGVGLYRAPKHDYFPPATLSTVNTCLEWNLLDRARTHLDYYLDRVVRADGTFDYYGPAVSEYGQMLDAAARYARRLRWAGCALTAAAWLSERVPILERIAGHLLALRRAGQERPQDDPRHGLLFGPAEADTCDEPACYYSGSAWAWRGLLELARAYAEVGDDALRGRAAELAAECEALHADIQGSIEKTLVRGNGPLFIPPMAGSLAPFPSMTADRLASYTNYRYWPEMLSAGCLRPEWHDAIIAYRAAHGGELLGTTRFMDRLDDWPYAHYAMGLLLRDRVQHYLLGFYGDLAVHRTRGAFMAYEQAAIRGSPTRTCVADYCVPADLVTPLMTKWMVVFEEMDEPVLWLCRATPRRWLAPGQRIRVRRAPTRWGLVSFTVEAKGSGEVAAEVNLPEGSTPTELRLRLRRPGAGPLLAVRVNGRPHDDFDALTETIRITSPAAGALVVVAR